MQDGNPQTLRIITLNGKGASGKGTEARKLLAENPRKTLMFSTGEMLRARLALGDPEVIPFKNDIEGRINLPDSLIMKAIKPVVQGARSNGITTIIFDGFPRTEAQYIAFEMLLDDEIRPDGPVGVDNIWLDVSDDTARFRTNLRRERDRAAEREPRKDDTDEKFKQGLLTFESDTLPMLKRLKGVIRIESDASEDVVHQRTMLALGIPFRRETIQETSLPRRARA